MQYFLRALLEENNVSLAHLSQQSQISEADLAAYIRGERKPGPEALRTLSQALPASIRELADAESGERGLSTYQLVQFFIESFIETTHEPERRASAPNLEAQDFQKLLNNIDQLGGWKKLLELTDKELFDREQREMQFEAGRAELLEALL